MHSQRGNDHLRHRPPPTFSGTVTGFVNGELQANVTSGTPSFTSLATASNNVGSYAITGSGVTANNSNYTFVQAAGNATAFSITQATLTATLTGTVTKPYDGTTAVTGTINASLAGVIVGDTVVVSGGTATINNTPNGRHHE